MATEETGASDTETETDDGPEEGGTETETEGGRQEAAGAATDGDRPTRKERRANRMADAERSRKEALDAIAQEREHRSRLESQLAELRGRMEEREQREAQPDIKQKIAQLRQRAESHLHLAANSKDATLARRELDAHYDLIDEIDELKDQARWQKRQTEIGQAMPNPARQQEINVLAATHPWIHTNKEARGFADVRFAALVEQGRPANRQTMLEALSWTAAKLGLGGKGAPNAASRGRFVGNESRDGEAGGAGSGAAMSVDDVRNNLAFKRMATGMYPQLEPEAAMAKWAKEIGSKARNGVNA